MAFTSSGRRPSRAERSAGRGAGRRAERAAPPPLDGPALEALALAYVARFATSTGKLADYLKRKLRERGWAEDVPADIPGIAARLAERGYVNDAGYAQAQGEGLRRRGYGARRIDSALDHAGIAPALRVAARGSETERRHAALAFARRKRIWPFASARAGDPATRQKHMAAFLRAGHGLDQVRAVMDAQSLEDAEEWADEHAEDASE
jgi:regulatory protein